MAKRLKGKVALITGSSSGIGAGVAKAYAREGADIVLNYPNKAEERDIWEIQKAIEKIGRKALVIKADVAEEAAVKRMVREALKTFGKIDILVNNAGHADRGGLLQDMPVAMFDRMIAVHLRGAFLCTKYVLPQMYERNYGKIINVSTQFAFGGTPLFTHYNAAKAGVIAMTHTLALDVGEHDINVNCVAMGATWTPMVEQVPPEKPKTVLAKQTKHRFGDVDKDIVPAFVFLASDESRFFVGQTLGPNGGDVFS
jgi:3-oxoacyl-[acyl-carrier protein] reductase